MHTTNVSGNSTFSNASSAVYEQKFACGVELCLSSAVLMFVVATVTVVGNSLLLLTINRNSQQLFRAPSTFLVANLGLSDLLVGLLVGYTVAVRDVFRYHELEVSDGVRVFIEVIEGVTMYVSGCTIIALSVDRYIAVSDPMRYRSRMTTGRIKVYISLVWISALSLCCLPLTGLTRKVYSIVYLQTHGTIPIFVLTVVCYRILRAFSNHHRQVEILRKSSANRRRDEQIERKLSHTVGIILALFYLTLLPAYVAMHLLYLYDASKDQSIILRKVDFISTRFLFLNSAVNPYIYAWRIPRYRHGFVKYLPFLKSKRNAQTTVLSLTQPISDNAGHI